MLQIQRIDELIRDDKLRNSIAIPEKAISEVEFLTGRNIDSIEFGYNVYGRNGDVISIHHVDVIRSISWKNTKNDPKYDIGKLHVYDEDGNLWSMDFSNNQQIHVYVPYIGDFKCRVLIEIPEEVRNENKCLKTSNEFSGHFYEDCYSVYLNVVKIKNNQVKNGIDVDFKLI